MRIIYTLILCLIFTVPSFAYSPSTVLHYADNSSEKTNEGKEFWLCFQRNFKDTETKPNVKNTNDLALELFISASKDATVTIRIEGLKYDTVVNVTAGIVLNIKIDKSAEIKTFEIYERLAVHIVADKPITVYGLSSRFQTTDAFLGFPVDVLGNHYMIIGYKYSEGFLSQFAIVATEDETKVTITPTATTSIKHAAGVPFTILLNRGDVYQVSSQKSTVERTDLTGSTISSTKKIAVFSGHQCAYVPEGIVGCNHLVEQMAPISTWGEVFFIGKLESRAKYSIRVLAHEANTTVYLNSDLVATLGKGEFYDNSELSQNSMVTSNHSVLVAQYSHGFLNGDAIGDPMMLLVSPSEQFMSEFRFATPKSGEWNHYINVVIPTRSISTLKIDGKSLNSNVLYENFDKSDYSIVQLRVMYGFHTISADIPFGMCSYGFGYGGQAYDAYGTMGGQSFNTIQETDNGKLNK
ncbi:MAG: IgGFc-binding protein [Ignavibacteria bacterium]|nr:IgGFc-binding protein [Ignavibacteria bacterium]